MVTGFCIVIYVTDDTRLVFARVDNVELTEQIEEVVVVGENSFSLTGEENKEDADR